MILQTGGTRLRGNLDQVKLRLLSHLERLPDGHDAQLFAVSIYDAHFTIADLLVNHEIVNTDAPPQCNSPNEKRVALPRHSTPAPARAGIIQNHCNLRRKVRSGHFCFTEDYTTSASAAQGNSL